MSAARQKAAEPAISGRQNFELHRAVKALARCEAICRSMAVYARFTHALDGEDRLEEMGIALADMSILADAVGWLHMDATEALDAAFPGIQWNYWQGDGGP